MRLERDRSKGKTVVDDDGRNAGRCQRNVVEADSGWAGQQIHPVSRNRYVSRIKQPAAGPSVRRARVHAAECLQRVARSLDEPAVAALSAAAGGDAAEEL